MGRRGRCEERGGLRLVPWSYGLNGGGTGGLGRVADQRGQQRRLPCRHVRRHQAAYGHVGFLVVWGVLPDYWPPGRVGVALPVVVPRPSGGAGFLWAYGLDRRFHGQRGGGNRRRRRSRLWSYGGFAPYRSHRVPAGVPNARRHADSSVDRPAITDPEQQVGAVSLSIQPGRHATGPTRDRAEDQPRVLWSYDVFVPLLRRPACVDR